MCKNGTRESQTFSTKPAAVQWGLDRDAELENADGLVRGRTMRDAFKRYAKEVSPSKRGARWEQIRLEKLCRDPIADITCQMLRLRDAEDFRDRALVTLAPNSVIRELTILKTVVRECVRWRWISAYPLTGVRNPKPGKARDRLPTDQELVKLQTTVALVEGATPATKRQLVVVMFLVAVETAMRLGELCSLDWSSIDIEARTAQLEETKNGDPRSVPLSPRALELLSWLSRDTERVFPISSDSASKTFGNIRAAAKIGDLTFHDSRHLATTRLAPIVGDVLELARVTGHRNINELMTYYNKSATQIAEKLAQGG